MSGVTVLRPKNTPRVRCFSLEPTIYPHKLAKEMFRYRVILLVSGEGKNTEA